MALIAGGIVGLISLFTGTTDKVIILSVLGALFMYCTSMISLIVWMKKIKTHAGFKTPFYPYFPYVALVLSLFCLIVVIVQYIFLSLIFFAGLAIALIVFVMMGKHKSLINEELLKEEISL